jgi:hypothetical protein
MKLHVLFLFLLLVSVKIIGQTPTLPHNEKVSFHQKKYSRVKPSKAMQLSRFIAKYRNDNFTAQNIFEANQWHKGSETHFQIIDGIQYLQYERSERTGGVGAIPLKLVTKFLE